MGLTEPVIGSVAPVHLTGDTAMPWVPVALIVLEATRLIIKVYDDRAARR